MRKIIRWGLYEKQYLYLILCITMIFCISCQAPDSVVHDFDNTVAGALCADDADYIYVSTPTTPEIVRIPKAGGDAVSLGFTGSNLLVQGDTLYFTDRNQAGGFAGDLYAYALTGDADPVCIASQSDSIIQYYPVGEQFFVRHYLTDPAMLNMEDGTAESLPYEIYLRVTEDESVGMDITGIEIDEETDCYPVYRTQGTEKTHLFDFYVFEAIHPKINNYCFFDGDVMYHVSDPDGVYTFTDNTCITRVAPDESGVYRSEILYECTDSLQLLGVGNGNLYAKRHDGTVLYIIGTDGVCRSEVPLDPNAMCFVGNTDGLLYAVNAEDMTYQTFGES